MLDTHTDCARPAARSALNRRAFLGRATCLGVAATAAPGPFGAALADAPHRDAKLFLIGLEEHFATRELQRLQAGTDKRLFSGGGPRPELLDLGAARIADMDEEGIGIQVLSAVTPGAQNLPGVEGVAFARKLNTWVAEEVVAVYPKRFRAFATLLLSEPRAAADELERAVREHGFVGCMSHGPIDGKFLDHADRAPVLARAEALGGPIYIHPNWPSPRAMGVYYDGLGDALASRILGGPGHGWHQEIALRCLRLIVSGTFDRFPRLQIVVGHMGEGLPFYYWRVGEDLDRIARDRLHKPVQQYFRDNLWITTSAFFRDELLALALATVGDDRIMFAVDYPMASAQAGADWFRARPGDQGEDRARERQETARDRRDLKAGQGPVSSGMSRTGASCASRPSGSPSNGAGRGGLSGAAGTGRKCQPFAQSVETALGEARNSRDLSGTGAPATGTSGRRRVAGRSLLRTRRWSCCSPRTPQRRSRTRAQRDLESLVGTSPAGVVFDGASARSVPCNREARRIVESVRVPGRPLEELVVVLVCRGRRRARPERQVDHRLMFRREGGRAATGNGQLWNVDNLPAGTGSPGGGGSRAA